MPSEDLVRMIESHEAAVREALNDVVAVPHDTKGQLYRHFLEVLKRKLGAGAAK